MTNDKENQANIEELRKKPLVPSVDKALDILEALSWQRDGLTMKELVAQLGRTMGEIYRIVLYLVERGYLEQDPLTARYSLTLSLFELAHRHPPTERLLRKAVPILERIAVTTEQSCHLGVLNRASVLILASVTSPRPAGYAVRTGAMFPAVDTSTGMVILAHSDEDAQHRFLDLLPKEGRETQRSRLARIIELGFEDSPSNMVSGVRNLCAPVFDRCEIVGAITCGYIDQVEQPCTPEETLRIVRQSALELSQALGYVGS